MQEFARRLKAARLAAGFPTAVSLARHMALDRRRLTHWETGYACPKMQELVQLCNTLNVEPNALVPARRASPMPRISSVRRAGGIKRVVVGK